MWLASKEKKKSTCLFLALFFLVSILGLKPQVVWAGKKGGGVKKSAKMAKKLARGRRAPGRGGGSSNINKPLKLSPEAEAYFNNANKQVYVYPSEGRRDPFQSAIKALKKQNLPPVDPDDLPDREKEPLEAFPLSSLSLVAIIDLDGKFMGFIQDPMKRGYTVRVGNRIGTKNGRITNITESSLDILEKNPQPRNPLATRTVTLALHSPKTNNTEDQPAEAAQQQQPAQAAAPAATAVTSALTVPKTMGLPAALAPR
ncbi:pilus assembly protein PilP [Magnetococcales bacterium HHB-1]